MPQPIASQLVVHPTFVGRLTELRWLGRCISEALAGRPQLALIIGRAGEGKTRLLGEACKRARSTPFVLGVGRADEHMELPYRLLGDALAGPLDALVQTAPELASHARALLGGAPATSATPGASRGEDVDPARAFQIVQDAVFALLASRPLLLRLDDLQWGDRPSLEGLLRLVSAASLRAQSGPVPLLVLCASRPVDAEHRTADVLARLRRDPASSVVELAGLTESDLAELLRGLAHAPAAPRLVGRIRELTRGNPLFACEIFHHLNGRGLLVQRGESARVDLARDELDLPLDLLSTVASRTRALPAETRRVLTLAACLGDTFVLDTLAAASGLDTETLLECLDEAVRAGVLVLEEGRFEFAHPLLRHASHREASELARCRLHLDIAGALERLHPGDDSFAPQIATHLIRAGPLVDRERLAQYARVAGDRAFASCAYGDAARCYEAVLATRGEVAAAAERAELHYVAGRAAYRDSDVEGATAHFERAFALHEAAGDVAGAARARLEWTRLRITLEPVPYGTLAEIGPLERALETLGEAEDTLRGRISSLLSGAHWTARQPERAEARAREAIEIGSRTGDLRLSGEAWTALSLAQTQTLQLDEAFVSSQRALEFARAAADPWLECTAHSRVPLLHLWRGELDAADAAARDCERVTNRIQAWSERSLADAARLSAAVARGRFAEAEAIAERVLRDAERSAYPWGAFNALPALAGARFAHGDVAGARAALARLGEPGAVFADPGPTVGLLIWVYEQRIRAEIEPPAALREQVAALTGGVPTEAASEIGAIAGFCAVAEIAAAVGEPTLAAAVLPALETAHARGVVLSAGWVFLLPRVLGIAFALLDETKRAALLLADAIDVAARAGARVELARSYLDAARLLARPGEVFDGSAARRLARRARELAASLELHGVARAAAALEGEVPSGGGPAPSADGHLRERLVSIAVGKDSHAASDLGRWLHEFLVRSDPEAGLAVAPATEIVPSAVGDVVVLMTDMVGSTERIERDGPAAALEAMQRHNKILRRCLAGSRGTEVQHTGDGVFAVFLDAADALACAVAIQRSFAHDRGSGETPIQVRVGLAVGPVLYEEGRLFGAPVNAAARLCAAAGPSRILCTDTVRLRAAGAWAQARALEPIALKGFESPLPICEIDW